MGKSQFRIKTLLTVPSYTAVLLGGFSLYGVADEFVFPFLILSFFLGISVDLKGYPKLPRLFLNLLGIIGSIFFLSFVSLENLINPVANALLFLTGIKLMEEKKARDYYQITLLAFLSSAVSTAVNPSLLYFFIFTLEVLLGVLILILISFYKSLGDKTIEREFVKHLILISLGFTFSTFILSWFFFVILPRANQPLFNLFSQRKAELISGISEEVELGKVGEIQLDRTVVLRVFGVDFKEKPYWRVSVLDTFTGKKWVKKVKIKEKEPLYPKGKKYTIILEPTYENYLPLLDFPVKIEKVEGINEKPLRFKGGFYEFQKPITKPLRITAYYTDKQPEDTPLPIYTQLPPNIPKSVKLLARKLQKGTKDNKEKIKRVKEFFKNNGFKYTLKLKRTSGDPLEDFLFKTKRGNCEYFASATAVLLRLMGVPARLVSGFYGAMKNDYGNYYIVLNAMAHVWVEAYDGKRWIRVDTTPPYVPEGVREVSKVALFYDAIITFWYNNVVNFNTQKQRKVFTNTLKALKAISKKLKENPTILLFPIIPLGFLFLIKKTRKTPENLYERLLKKLKKYGIEAKLPEEVLEKAKGEEIYPYVKFVVRAYQRWKYSKVKDKEELKEAYKVLKKI